MAPRIVSFSRQWGVTFFSRGIKWRMKNSFDWRSYSVWQDVVKMCSTKQHILFFFLPFQKRWRVQSWRLALGVRMRWTCTWCEIRLASSSPPSTGLETRTSCSDVCVTGCIDLDAVLLCNQNEGTGNCRNQRKMNQRKKNWKKKGFGVKW